MQLLLDTHAAIWWLSGSDRLRPSTRATIDDPANERFLSAASVWEMAIKRRTGKYEGVDLLDALAVTDLIEVPITATHGRLAGELPAIHTDPFDRVIVAQALVGRLVLVTGDEVLEQYGCATLW